MTGAKDRTQAFHFIGMIQFGVCHKETSEVKLPKPLGKQKSNNIEHPRSSKYPGCSQLPNDKGVFSQRGGWEPFNCNEGE